MSNARPSFFRSALAVAISYSLLYPLSAMGGKKIIIKGRDYYTQKETKSTIPLEPIVGEGFDVTPETASEHPHLFSHQITKDAYPEIRVVDSLENEGLGAAVHVQKIQWKEQTVILYSRNIITGEVAISRHPNLNFGKMVAEVDPYTGLAKADSLRKMAVAIQKHAELQPVTTEQFEVMVEPFKTSSVEKKAPGFTPLAIESVPLSEVHQETSMPDSEVALCSVATAVTHLHGKSQKKYKLDAVLKSLHDDRGPLIKVSRDTDQFHQKGSTPAVWVSEEGDESLTLYSPRTNPQAEAFVKQYMLSASKGEKVELKLSPAEFRHLSNTAKSMQADIVLRVAGTEEPVAPDDNTRLIDLQLAASTFEYASQLTGSSVQLTQKIQESVSKILSEVALEVFIGASLGEEHPVVWKRIRSQKFRQYLVGRLTKHASPTFTTADAPVREYFEEKLITAKDKLFKELDGQQQLEDLKAEQLERQLEEKLKAEQLQSKLEEEERLTVKTQTELREAQEELVKLQNDQKTKAAELELAGKRVDTLEQQVRAAEETEAQIKAKLPIKYKETPLAEAVEAMAKEITAEKPAQKAPYSAAAKTTDSEARVKELEGYMKPVKEYVASEEKRLRIKSDQTKALHLRLRQVSEQQKVEKTKEQDTLRKLQEAKQAVDEELATQQETVQKYETEAQKHETEAQNLKATVGQLNGEIEAARKELKATEEDTLAGAVRRLTEAREQAEFNKNELDGLREELKLKETELAEALKKVPAMPSIAAEEDEAVAVEKPLGAPTTPDATRQKELEEEVNRLKTQITEKEAAHKEELRQHQKEVQKATNKQIDEQAAAHKEETARLQKELDALKTKQPVAGAQPEGDRDVEIDQLKTKVTQLEEAAQAQAEDQRKALEEWQGKTDTLTKDHQQALEQERERAGRKLNEALAEARGETEALKRRLGHNKKPTVQRRLSDPGLAHPGIEDVAIEEPAPIDHEAIAKELKAQIEARDKLDTELKSPDPAIGIDAIAKTHIARFMEAGVEEKYLAILSNTDDFRAALRANIPRNIMPDETFLNTYSQLIWLQNQGADLTALVPEVAAMPDTHRKHYSSQSDAPEQHRLPFLVEKPVARLAEKVLLGRVDFGKLEEVAEFYARTPNGIHPYQPVLDKSGLTKKVFGDFLEHLLGSGKDDLVTRKIMAKFEGDDDAIADARARMAAMGIEQIRRAKMGEGLTADLTSSAITFKAVCQTVSNAGWVVYYKRLNFYLDDIYSNGGKLLFEALQGGSEYLDEVLMLSGLSSQEELAEDVFVALSSLVIDSWESVSQYRPVDYLGTLPPMAALLVQAPFSYTELFSVVNHLKIAYGKMGPATVGTRLNVGAYGFLAISFLSDFARGAHLTKRMILAFDPLARKAALDFDSLYRYMDETASEEDQPFLDVWLGTMKYWNRGLDSVAHYTKNAVIVTDWMQYTANAVMLTNAVGSPLLQRFGLMSPAPNSANELLFGMAAATVTMGVQELMYDFPLGKLHYAQQYASGPVKLVDWVSGYNPASNNSYSYFVSNEMPKYSPAHEQSYLKDNPLAQSYKAKMETVNDAYEWATAENILKSVGRTIAGGIGNWIIKPVKQLIWTDSGKGANPPAPRNNSGTESLKTTKTNESSNITEQNTNRPGPALTPVDPGAVMVDSSSITPSSPSSTSTLLPNTIAMASEQRQSVSEPKETPTPPQEESKEEPATPPDSNTGSSGNPSEKTSPPATESVTEPDKTAAEEPPAQKEAKIETPEQKRQRERLEKRQAFLGGEDDG